MPLPLEESQQLCGMTLADFAAARHTHPQAIRKEYRDLLRLPGSLTLPPITRRTDDADRTTKFCLPVGSYSGGGAGNNNGSGQPNSAAKNLESESVIIPMKSYRGSQWFTLCLSSQIGCRMGCTFCETGRMGLLKNLTSAQIVQQRLVARQIRIEQGTLRSESTPLVHATASAESASPPPASRLRYFADGIQNIVFMGMGEPLDNLDNVLQAIRVFSEPSGLDFPLGQITVSTVGRIDGLQKLAAIVRTTPVWGNLRIAISLNAASDALRDQLMPINRGMPLAALKQTLLDYPLPARGRFLIEYVLIKEINDTPADAQAVADFCAGLPCIVNLIPYNPQRSAAYQTPAHETIMSFMALLKSRGLFVKRRVTHGRDLMGACGQLGNPEIRRTSPASRNPAGALPILSSS